MGAAISVRQYGMLSDQLKVLLVITLEINFWKTPLYILIVYWDGYRKYFLMGCSSKFSYLGKVCWFYFMLLMKTFLLFSTPNNTLSLRISYDYDERSSIQIFKGILQY